MALMILPFRSCSVSVCSRSRMNRSNSFALRAADMTFSIVSVRSKRQGASLDIFLFVSRLRCASFVAFLTLLPLQAWAATGLDGAAMRWPYALPFAGLLLSIALGPLLFPKIWHHHYGKIAAAWSLAALVSLVILAGGAATLAALVH